MRYCIFPKERRKGDATPYQRMQAVCRDNLRVVGLALDAVWQENVYKKFQVKKKLRDWGH